MAKPEPLRIFVGYDETESLAHKVCVESIKDQCSVPVLVEPLRVDKLRMMGVYKRNWYRDGEQRYDTIDGKPFSTDFSFSRFLVPALCQYMGYAMFVDSDFVFLHDPALVFAECRGHYPLWCVKHNFKPERGTKMRGQKQEPYYRKLWTSLMVINCGHATNAILTPYMVNQQPGSWLQQLRWLNEGDIGALNPRWNWIEGHSTEPPFAVHFTRGTPDMPGHEDALYADAFREYADKLQRAA
jgi:hypothetical protein